MRRLLSLALALAIVGCGSDDSSTTPTTSSVAGTWTLQTVNGSALPFTLSSIGTTKIELVSSVVNVSSNGTWTSTTQTRTTINNQATTNTSADGGTYTLNGNAVAITSSGGTSGVQTGTVSGNTLTLAQAGFSFVYKKS